MLEHYKQELAAVQASILRLESDPVTSQSVSSANGGSFSSSYVELTRLHAREKELITLISALNREHGGCGGLGLTYPIYC